MCCSPPPCLLALEGGERRCGDGDDDVVTVIGASLGRDPFSIHHVFLLDNEPVAPLRVYRPRSVSLDFLGFRGLRVYIDEVSSIWPPIEVDDKVN